MKERVILHSDMNCCYASIEHLHRPELQNRPLAVGGDPNERHGIILTADYKAKKYGVKTGMALWQARQMCPSLVIVPPRMDLYLRFSRMAHEIYGEYSDRQEPFGIDESWIDVTESAGIYGNGQEIAEKIRMRVKEELGITVSVGVSFNKIFAKLGSDMKKPDAVTLITKKDYKKTVWQLPAGDLLCVGRSTQKKLHKLGINTIGELATADEDILQVHLGKMGIVIRAFANGEDDTPVRVENEHAPIKSIGNSTTAPRDLTDEEDVRILVYVLSESVAARLRENGFRCRTVEISIRDTDLFTITRQKKLLLPTNITAEIAQEALSLFREQYAWEKPVRSIGVRGMDLVTAYAGEQMTLFSDWKYREKQIRADMAVDEIRKRFGYECVQRGLMYTDRELSRLNAKEDHVIHPHSYFG